MQMVMSHRTVRLMLAAGLLWSLWSLWSWWQGLVGAQGEERVVFKQEFEEEAIGWVDFLTQTPARITRDKADVKVGNGALAYAYELKPGNIPALVLQGLGLPGARSLRFWMKCSTPTIMAVGLQEGGGARYLAPFYCSTQWQEVHLSLPDFSLSLGTQDANNRLDTDQVNLIGFVDFSGLMTVMGGGQGEPAARTMFLDDLVVSDAALPPRFVEREIGGGVTESSEGFEKPTLFWMPVEFSQNRFGLDAAANLTVTQEAANVKSGTGALQYSYTVKVKEARITALGSPLRLPLVNARSVRLWLKPSHTCPFIFGFHERDESRYQTAFYLPANQWSEVGFSLRDLELAEDAQDENGKLDLDQVDSLYMIDATHFLGQLMPELLGERKLWVDDVTFSTAEVPAAKGLVERAGERVFLVDNFEAQTIRWLPLAIEVVPQLRFMFAPDAKLSLVDNEPGQAEGKHSLCVDYIMPPQTAFAVGTMGRTQAVLKGAPELRLWLRTKNDVTVYVGLEEKDNSRYTYQVSLKKDEGWKQFKIKLSDFKLEDNSKDENNQLNLEQVTQIGVADVSGVLEGGGGANTLFIDEIALVLPAQ